MSISIKCSVTLLAVSLAGAPAAGARDVAVTVYNQDLAVVRDRREVTVERGASELRFTDVAARIDPTSVHLDGPITVREQNYSYDLASADKILRRYLDESIDVLAEEGRTYRGRLLSFDGSSLVLGGVAGGGDVVIVERDGVQDIRFPTLPEGLITRPTLIWKVESATGGPAPVELSYMTGGCSWHAEYVAVIADDESTMELSGWVSIDNRSGAVYPDAKLKLVAGEVHRAPAPRAKGLGIELARTMAATDGGFQERAFFEYHIYELDRRTTIADQEIKQLALFEPATTPVEKRYELDAARRGDRIEVILEGQNRRDVGLGMPLPAGTVRAMKADRDGQLEFVGEDRIDHTPRDEEIRVTLGTAFDLKAERVVKDHRRISDRVRQEVIEIKLRNHKDAPVEILVIERPHGDWEVLEASHPYEKTEAFKLEMKVRVAPDREEVVTYTIRTR